MLAIQIERYYTKQQILTMYCNLHFMGHGQYGFAAAAEFYFGKELKDLNIEEAAMLAAIPRSPPNYSPILHPDRALMRRNYAIDRMVAEKKITVAQGEEAKVASDQDRRKATARRTGAIFRGRTSPVSRKEVRHVRRARRRLESLLDAECRRAEGRQCRRARTVCVITTNVMAGAAPNAICWMKA